MAIRPAVGDMQTYVVEHCDSDLLYILGECKTAIEQQYDIVLGGYSSLRAFSGIADNRAEVRIALTADFGLDVTAQPPAGAANRLALAALVSAWEIAKEQFSKENQLRAESKVLRITRPVATTDKAGMRRAVEGQWGKIPSREAPSTDYLSQKLEELEQNEPVASPLDEVTSQTDIESSNVTANLDLTGKVQILRKRAKSTLPANPEEFRLRLRVERNMWLYMKAKFSNKPWLVGLTPGHWDTWTDYFLGHKVMLLDIPTAEGSRVSLHPPWQIIISYEFECRKKIIEFIMEEGMTMIDAMQRTIRDGELKEIGFTSPLALMNRGTKRSFPETERSDKAQAARGPKAEGKGRKKGNKKNKEHEGGKSKGKGKGKLLSKTPDGRKICYAFNSSAGCSNADCAFAHLCQRKACLSPDHNSINCPNA